jgi:hypothetical protein
MASHRTRSSSTPLSASPSTGNLSARSQTSPWRCAAAGQTAEAGRRYLVRRPVPPLRRPCEQHPGAHPGWPGPGSRQDGSRPHRLHVRRLHGRARPQRHPDLGRGGRARPGCGRRAPPPGARRGPGRGARSPGPRLCRGDARRLLRPGGRHPAVHPRPARARRPAGADTRRRQPGVCADHRGDRALGGRAAARARAARRGDQRGPGPRRELAGRGHRPRRRRLSAVHLRFHAHRPV